MNENVAIFSFFFVVVHRFLVTRKNDNGDNKEDDVDRDNDGGGKWR